MICSNCGNENTPDTEFCTNCGTRVRTEHCTNCGSPLVPGSTFCTACGSSVEEPAAEEPNQRGGRAFALAAAAIGALILVGGIWVLTNNSATDEAGDDDRSIQIAEGERQSSDEDEPPESTVPASTIGTTAVTVTVATSISTTTTVDTASQAVAVYAASLNSELAEAQGIVDEILQVNTTWELNEGRVSQTARSNLYRATETAFLVGVRDLGFVESGLASISPPPPASAAHANVVAAIAAVRDEAQLALDGLRLPRGSETVDGTVRRRAIENLQREMADLTVAVATAISAAG